MKTRKIVATFLSLLLCFGTTFVKADYVNEENNAEALRHPTYGISFKNQNPIGKSTDYSVVASSGTLEPGESQTFEVSYSKMTSISTGIDVEKIGLFNVTFNFSKNETVKIRQSYDYTCRKTNSKCTVKYYPQYTKYSYDEYLFGQYSTSGTASVLTGFEQVVD